MAVRLLVCCCFLLFISLPARTQPRVDQHGFPLPAGVVARLGDLHFAQPGMITAMALAPDGKTIATAGAGIFLWDAARGWIVREIAAAEGISLLAFSRDGTLLAAAASDGALSVWNVADGMPRWQGKGLKDKWRAHISGLRFLPGDRLLAAARYDTEANVSPAETQYAVQLWDAATGELKQCWKGSEVKQQLPRQGKNMEIVDVALSPSGDKLAWLAAPTLRDNPHCTAFVHETVTGRLLREVKELRAPAEKIDLLDEGQHLLLKSTWFVHGKETRDEKGTVVVESLGSHAVVNVHDRQRGFRFDYRLAYFISRPGGERRYVRTLGVAPDGKSVYLQDEVGMLRWDLATGKLLQTWPDHCTSLEFFSDGKRALMARGNRLLICDEKLTPLRSETEIPETPYIQFLPDGRLAAARWRGGRLNLWDLRKRQIVETVVRHKEPLTGRTPCSWDACCKLFAYQSENGIVVKDLVPDRPLARLDGVSTAEDCWNVSPMLCGDGQRVLVSSREKDALLVRWFDTRSGRELGRRCIVDKERFPHPRRTVEWFTHDGTVFGHVAPDGRLVLMDCRNQAQTVQLGIPESTLSDVVESSLNWPLWSYASDGFDRWVTATRPLKSLPGSMEYVIWGLVQGQMVRRFVLQPLQIAKEDPQANWHWSARLAPDGRNLAVLLNKTEVKLFDTATGRLRGALRAPNPIGWMAFGPGGKTLATSCADTSILLWDVQWALDGTTELSRPTSSAEADRLWDKLADPDPALMAPALAALRHAPTQALALLKRRLRPVRGPEPEQLATLIASLDGADFGKRQAAARALLALPEYAPGPLRTALAKPRSLEQKRRIEDLLPRLEISPPPPSCLRELRALELLESLPTPEARRLIELLATGHPDSLATREARLVLARWSEDRKP